MKIPEINLLDDKVVIKIRSHTVELIIKADENGSIIIRHENGSPMVYKDNEIGNPKITQEILIER